MRTFRSRRLKLLNVPKQKENVFVLGCSGRAPPTQSTEPWPSSKRDHLSPKLGLAKPALAALVRQKKKGTCRVDVAQQASKINRHLFPSAHIPPLLPAACCSPLYHQQLSLSFSPGRNAGASQLCYKSLMEALRTSISLQLSEVSQSPCRRIITEAEVSPCHC